MACRYWLMPRGEGEELLNEPFAGSDRSEAILGWGTGAIDDLNVLSERLGGFACEDAAAPA